MLGNAIKRRIFTLELDILLLTSILEELNTFRDFENSKYQHFFWKHVEYTFNDKHTKTKHKTKTTRQLKARLKILYTFYTKNIKKISLVKPVNSLHDQFTLNIEKVFDKISFSSNNFLIQVKSSKIDSLKSKVNIPNKISDNYERYVNSVYASSLFHHNTINEEEYSWSLVNFMNSEGQINNFRAAAETIQLFNSLLYQKRKR